MRVDILPNKLYKFNGNSWMQIAKKTDTYLNEEYVIHLTDQVTGGFTDIEDLTIQEQQEVENELRRRNSSNRT